MKSGKTFQAERAAPPRAVIAAAALALALSLSCVESAPAGPIPALIPADALAAVVVESPYKLFAAAEAFWKSAGLDATFGSDLQGLLKSAVPNAAEAQQSLDFARPWALAVLPSLDPGEPQKTRQVLYLPYRAKPDGVVERLLGSGTMKPVADAKGYIVLSDAKDGGGFAFPPAKAADLSRLSRYPASSVKLWGDPAALRRMVSGGYKPIHEAIRRFVTPPPAAAGLASADPKAATRALGELGLSLLAQLGLADAALELGPAGLVMRLGASAKAGSDFQKALAAASFAPPALDWAPQVGSSAMYGYAWSMDPGISAGLSARLMESLFSSLGLPQGIAAKAIALQAKWAKATGPRGAMTMDMDIDPSAIAGAKDLKSEDPAAIADLLKRMLSIKFDLFQEVRDEAAYRALLRGMAADPDYLAFSKAYVDAFGLSLAVRNQDKKDGAFSYGELGLDFKVVDPTKLGGLEGGSGSASTKAATDAVLAAIGSMTKMRWTVSNGRFVATGGDAAALKALAARKAAAKGMTSDPAFAAFAKTMPPKTFLVGALSMRKLIGLVTGILAADTKGGATGGGPAALLPDPSQFGSWYSYLAVDARGLSPGLEAGFLIPAADIGALAKSGGALIKGQSGGGAGI